MTVDRHVLILVQNLPVPLDRRVWNECGALVDAGYRVSVVCPQGPGDPAYEVLDGVRLYKYRPPPPARGTPGFVFESVYCWLRTVVLAWYVHRREPLDAIQACNPPDTFWALAALFRRWGVRFVFDHHDLCPELYRSRFGRDRGPAVALLLALERASLVRADHVICTNESYRSVARHRGGRSARDTSIVRSGPDPERLRPGPEEPALRRGRAHLCCYLGVMGHQDGVDAVVRAAHLIVHEWGRDDVTFALLGFGDCLAALRRLTHELDLDEHVVFTGRVELPEICDYLSTAAVGLAPDPPSPFNDLSTMNKTLEYMACGLPVVSFDLHESRVSAGDAATYVPGGDVEAFAREIVALLDDPDRRARMGRIGRSRIESGLGWPEQAAAYVSVYDDLFGVRRVRATASMARRTA